MSETELKDDRYISIIEAAKYLGVSRNTVLNFISGKGLPAVKIGNLWKVKKSELDKWILETNKNNHRKDEK